MTQPSASNIRLWRNELQDPLTPPPRPNRAGWIFGVLAAMLALGGLFIGILFWITPAPGPLFIPICITQSESLPISQVPFIRQDLQALGQRNFFHNEKNSGYTSQQAHQILSLLRELEDDSQPVVVYLSALALRAGQGEIYLLPADAQPDNPASRLALKDVLHLLKKCPAANKLLILDITHDFVDPRLGSLSNDVGMVIPAAVEEVDDPNLLVLTSCSPGQHSLTSEAMGRTVFSHYLEQGLRGWADGFLGGSRYDGRISVKELAAFTRERVDRWARMNRATRQMPMLLGKGKNFHLRTYFESDKAPPEKLPPIPEYPKWLQEGWKSTEATYSSGEFALTPYRFRYQTSLLLRAEQLWREGADPQQIQSREMAAFAQIENTLKQKRSFPQPQPQSLTLAARLSGKSPLALTKELDQLLVDWKNAASAGKPEDIKAARTKILTAFQEKVKDKEYLPLAQAVFTRVVEFEQPTLEEIQLLNGLLPPTTKEKQPLLLETLLLQQLAEEKTPRNPDSLKLMLQVTARGEQAASSLLGFPWNKVLLEEAAQLRHDGEIRFWARGYADPEEAEQLLKKALNSYEVILANAKNLEEAHNTLDEAMFFLPSYLPYLRVHPELEQVWMEAVLSATNLWQGFLDFTSEPTLVTTQIKSLVPLSSAVRQNLESLRQPFLAETISHLVVLSQHDRPKVSIRNEIVAILNTPFLKPDERTKLWKGLMEMERRLHQKTIDLDQEDNENQQTINELPPFEEAKAIGQIREHGKRQARWMLALLHLGGFQVTRLNVLNNAFTHASSENGSEADWYKFADSLRRALGAELREQYLEESTSVIRDRLIRMFPPLDGPPGLQADQPADAAQALGEDARQLWNWLADRYQYQARDYQESGLDAELVRSIGQFFAKGASAYKHLAIPTQERYLQLSGGKDIPLLTLQRPEAKSSLQVRLVGAKKEDLEKPIPLEMLPPNKDWLQISPKSLLLSKLTPDLVNTSLQTTVIPFEVKLRDTAEVSPYPAPKGFLAEAKFWNRSFHQLVKVPLRTSADELQIILSPNPKTPDPQLEALRLRPGKVPQTFFLYVYNPTSEPRKIIVQVLANGELLKGGEVPLTVAAKESKKVILGAGAAPPPSPATPPPKVGAPPAKVALPLLQGNLQIRLLDGDDKKLVLADRNVEVAISHPREYVTVSSIQFDPAAPRNQGKNQLSVSLETLTSVPGPDIPVELELPLHRIPSLISVKDGTYLGKLPASTAKPTKLILFAKDLKLEEAADPEGYIYVHADGYKRCFIYRTTFSPRGDPLTPKGFALPQVHFSTKQYVVADPRFTIVVEVDNAPDKARLEVNLGQLESEKFQPDIQEKFPLPKNNKIGFALDAASGGLLFEASLEDWEVVLDTSKIRGKRQIRAALIDEYGKVLAQGEQTLVIDDTPPQLVKFVKVPPKAQKGKKILVRAIGSDPESGIKEVFFFVGALENGKVPPKTALVRAFPGGKGSVTWEAELPLPEDKKGPTDITVQVTNNAGLSNYDKATVELMDTDPATTGPGNIRGKVVYDGLPQPDLPVFLYDAKGKVLNKTMTDKEGVFMFTDLKPDQYILYTLKKGSKRDGTANVQVKANETANVSISLKLK